MFQFDVPQRTLNYVRALCTLPLIFEHFGSWQIYEGETVIHVK